MKKIKISKKIIVIGVVLLVLVTIFAVSCSNINSTRKKMQQYQKNQTFTVKKGNISSSVSGTGNLEMNETENVNVPIGVVVKKVTVENGDVVKKGQVLAKLDKASIAGELSEAEDKRDDLEEQLEDSDLSDLEIEKLTGEKKNIEDVIEQLEKLYEKPQIVATCAGVIGEINVTEDTEVSKTVSNSSSNSATNSTENINSEASVSATVQMSTGDTKVKISTLDSRVSVGGTDINVNELEPETIIDYSKLVIKAPVKGEIPQSKIEETDTYTGQITWNCTGTEFKADTVYTATIILTAKDGYTFKSSNVPVIASSNYDWDIVDEGGNKNQLKILASYEKTGAENTVVNANVKSDTEKAPSQSNKQKSESTTVPNNYSQNNVATGDNGNINNEKSSIGSGSSDNAVMASNTGTSTGYSTESTDTYNSYNATAFTIQLQDKVKISISVDEKDILNVEKGQKATITLDAIESQEFMGKISKILSAPVIGSGSTKYTVEISVNKDENMKNGMSASVSIVTGNTEDALLIPINALQEEGNKKFVYTKQDNENNLSGVVNVETGVSDSKYVEITKGLQEGDKVYYTRTDSEDSENAGMMMGSMGPMGGNSSGSSQEEE